MQGGGAPGQQAQGVPGAWLQQAAQAGGVSAAALAQQAASQQAAVQQQQQQQTQQPPQQQQQPQHQQQQQQQQQPAEEPLDTAMMEAVVSALPGSGDYTTTRFTPMLQYRWQDSRSRMQQPHAYVS
jgi:hypothetical protein